MGYPKSEAVLLLFIHKSHRDKRRSIACHLIRSRFQILKAVDQFAQLLRVFGCYIFLLPDIFFQIIELISISQTDKVSVFLAIRIILRRNQCPVTLTVGVIEHSFNDKFFTSFLALAQKGVQGIFTVQLVRIRLP